VEDLIMSKYVMIDLEMCNVPRGTKGFEYKNEIIEIGAVLMDERR
jgi:DNA polymerase III epsilon subunit-like protein